MSAVAWPKQNRPRLAEVNPQKSCMWSCNLLHKIPKAKFMNEMRSDIPYMPYWHR